MANIRCRWTCTSRTSHGFTSSEAPDLLDARSPPPSASTFLVGASCLRKYPDSTWAAGKTAGGHVPCLSRAAGGVFSPLPATSTPHCPPRLSCGQRENLAESVHATAHRRGAGRGCGGRVVGDSLCGPSESGALDSHCKCPLTRLDAVEELAAHSGSLPGALQSRGGWGQET